MNVKTALIAVLTLLIVLAAATPVMAFGPDNAKGNPNAVTTPTGDGFVATEIWLPSGVMNEWVNYGPIAALRTQILDASKVQIKQAIVSSDPFDVFFAPENTWYYLTSEQLGIVLASFGLDASRADAYTAGLYMRLFSPGPPQ